MISVAQLAPLSGSSSSQKPDIPGTLAKLLQIPDEHPFVSMSKGDLCMSLYRHVRLLKLPIDKNDILSIITIGNNATNAAWQLAQEQRYWWNVLVC